MQNANEAVFATRKHADDNDNEISPKCSNLVLAVSLALKLWLPEFRFLRRSRLVLVKPREAMSSLRRVSGIGSILDSFCKRRLKSQLVASD